MEPARRFEVVEDEPTTEPAKTQVDQAHAAATQALFIALKALSQRAVVALSNLFCLISVASAFWLWSTIPDPNPYQITSLTIYAVFVLVANVIVRRKF